MTSSVGLLRAAAMTAVPIGVAGSLGFMLRAGRNAPRFLLVLFALWVLAPFMAFVVANVVLTRRSVLNRAALDGVMLAVTLVSLAIYGYVALGPPRAQAAFSFVVIPPAFLLLIAIVALISLRRSRRDGGV